MEQKIIAVVAGREIKESDFEKFLQNVPREQQAYLSNPQFRQDRKSDDDADLLDLSGSVCRV